MGSIDKLLQQENSVFTYSDLAMVWKTDNKKALEGRVSYLVKMEKLKRLGRGIFSVVGREYTSLELANRIRPISYISFETALVLWGFTFQVYNSIFSASNLSRTYEIDGKKYIYRKLKDDILTNPLGVEKMGLSYNATAERAVLDMLYINSDFPIEHLERLNFEKAFELVKIYKSKKLESILNKIKKNYD